MKTMKQNDTQSILFVVLCENDRELKFAWKIPENTETCAAICINENESHYDVCHAFASALGQYPALRMVVFVVPFLTMEPKLLTLLTMANCAKERGLITVVATIIGDPGMGPMLPEFYGNEALAIKQVFACADCILGAPVWQRRYELQACSDAEAYRQWFYWNVQKFQGFMNDLLEGNSFIYLDFDDISSVLCSRKFAFLGIECIQGADASERILDLERKELLPKDFMEKTPGAILHIAGPEDMDLAEVEAIVDIVSKDMGPDGKLPFSAEFDSSLHDEVRISIVATGGNN